MCWEIWWLVPKEYLYYPNLRIRKIMKENICLQAKERTMYSECTHSLWLKCSAICDLLIDVVCSSFTWTCFVTSTVIGICLLSYRPGRPRHRLCVRYWSIYIIRISQRRDGVKGVNLTDKGRGGGESLAKGCVYW